MDLHEHCRATHPRIEHLPFHLPRLRAYVARAARVAILVGGAAIEALLLEAAYIKNPQLYKQDKFRGERPSAKCKDLTGKELIDISPNADELWKWRVALGHTEPDNERTRFVGTRIDANGAEWVNQTLENLAVIIWGKDMPDWFAQTAKFGRPTRIAENFGHSCT